MIGSDSEPDEQKENSQETQPPLPKKSKETLATTAAESPPKTSEQPVTYAALCAVFAQIEETTKRLQILDFLVGFLVRVIQMAPESLLAVVYLCLNKLGPEYEGMELGIGESLLIKAIALSSGQTTKAVKADLQCTGDLGSVAQSCRAKQKLMFVSRSLLVAQVFRSLKEIARISGDKAQQRKVDRINQLLVTCRNTEPKFLVRSLEGKLRIGLAEQTVLVALAHAAVLSRVSQKCDTSDTSLSHLTQQLSDELDEASVTLKAVYNELPCYDRIIPVLLEHDVQELSKHCRLTPGIPLKPMLAHPTKSLIEVFDRFEGTAFTCEHKYDGERAQIYRLPDGSVCFLSRNSENLSAKYPDIVARLPRISKSDVSSYVLDCKAVA